MRVRGRAASSFRRWNLASECVLFVAWKVNFEPCCCFEACSVMLQAWVLWAGWRAMAIVAILAGGRERFAGIRRRGGRACRLVVGRGTERREGIGLVEVCSLMRDWWRVGSFCTILGILMSSAYMSEQGTGRFRSCDTICVMIALVELLIALNAEDVRLLEAFVDEMSPSGG